MVQSFLHDKILHHCQKINDWYKNKAQHLAFPFYTSYDVRDSGYIIAPVDANIYPAGFNNICATDKEHAIEVAKKYISRHYEIHSGAIGLITEEHTQNPYYWENVRAIREILMRAGYEVLLATLNPAKNPMQVQASGGEQLTVYAALRESNSVKINGKSPQILISNNDFSVSYEDWAEGLDIPINPPREMGWYRRKKHIFFETYNQLAREFSKLIDADVNSMLIETELFANFDVNSEESREALAVKVGAMLEKLRKKYAIYKTNYEPFVFVKNNSGTYGLAVIKVKSGDEVRSWSYKSRKKMKASKGGRDVEEVIIQEGIPTKMKEQNDTAEPCIYMIGCELVGGFLRTHAEKDAQENLNSPGAVYRRLCMADLLIKQPDCPRENVYGWIAKLSVLAAATEAEKIGAQFRGYNIFGCGT